MKRKLPLRIPGAAFVAVELALFSFQSVAQTPAPRSRTCGSAFAAAAPADGVVTRTYGAPAAPSPGSVATREISPPPPPPEGGVSPLAISLLPGVGIPTSGDWSVAGLRIDILAGRHRDVWGLDVGLVGNEVSVNLEGIQVAGIFNRIGRSDGAVQIAGIVNRCEGDFSGLQAAGIDNWTDGAVDGLQVALVNRAAVLSGLQIGLYNSTDNGSGVQIGLINSARSFDGVQIGVFNVIRESTLPFLPIVNFAF